MTLRSRLTAAFFAISVVPLSAVTLFSYVSSERALRRAAEQQANELADDLSRRMQWVTTDIERRLDRGWQTAMPPQPGPRVAANEPQRSGPRASTGRPIPSAQAPAGPTAGPDAGGRAPGGRLRRNGPPRRGARVHADAAERAGSRSGRAGRSRDASRSAAGAAGPERGPEARSPRPGDDREDGQQRRDAHHAGDEAVRGRKGPDHPGGGRGVDGEAPAADPSGAGPAAAHPARGAFRRRPRTGRVDHDDRHAHRPAARAVRPARSPP